MQGAIYNKENSEDGEKRIADSERVRRDRTVDRLIEQASRYLREHRAYRRYLSVFLCLALAIAGGTVALLTRPGIAMTVTATVLQCPYVGVAAHTHNDDCCDESDALVCPLPERALHQHSDACYTETRVLICTREETPGHIHTEACFTRVRGELLCENTDEEHVHDDSCYAWDNVLTCGFAEGEGTHIHGEDCYETVRTLTCGQEEILEEHIHGPGCFIEIVIEEPDPTAEPTVEPTAEPEPTAAPTAEPETTSEPEPTVEPGPQGDPTADVEEYWQWAAMVRDLDLTGDWNEDLIKVARTQLGYTESQFNFIEENGQYRSYTRCGA